MWSIYAFVSSLVTGINSILQKETLKHLHAVQLMTISTFTAVLFGLAFLPFYNFSVGFKGLALIALAAVIQAFASIFTVRAMRHMDVSIVAPFFNLGTAFTAIFAALIFKESLNAIDVIGISLLVIGGYFLELKHKNPLQPIKDMLKSSSIHYLLGGVFLFSSGYLLLKYILETVHPIPLFFYQHLIMSLVFLTITFTVYKGASDIKEGIKKGKWLIPLMALLLIGENVFLFQALETGKASLVIPIYRTWTLWAVIFGGRILHENNVMKRTVASILMVLGAAIILIW